MAKKAATTEQSLESIMWNCRNALRGTVGGNDKNRDAVMGLVFLKFAGDKLGADAHIKARNISLAALNGAVGTPENPLDIDTDAGAGGRLTASAAGDGININEISGDLIIDLITASNDGTVNIVADGAILAGTINSTGGGGVTLTAEDGDIKENGGTDAIKAAAEAEMAAAQARSAANLAAAQS